MYYDWNWSTVWTFGDVLAIGAAWTAGLSLTAIVIGTLLGVAMAIAISSAGERSPLRLLLILFTDVVRALPLLILILLANYTLPSLIGLRSLFWVSALALSLNLSAFICDVLRGAIRGVPAPLVEAALSVGMTDRQALNRIVVPEAIRSVVPSFSLLYIDILKMSSLASVIGFSELTHVASDISSKTFHPLEVTFAVGAIYVAIVLPLAHLQRSLERSPAFARRS